MEPDDHDATSPAPTSRPRHILDRTRGALRRWPSTLLMLTGLGLAMAVRLTLFGFEGNDYKYFMGPWYDYIATHGGFSALKDAFSDYSPPYLYLLVVATWLPVKKLYAIKLVSVVFDFLLAAGVGWTVRERYRTGPLPGLALLLTLFAPTVLVNSALWGQNDSIFVSFLVLTVLFLVRGQTSLAAVVYGVALAFKAQAVFLAPVFAVLLLKKRLRPLQAMLVPAAYLVLMLPALIAGRPVRDLLLIYTRQAGEYPHLTMGAPNLYQWLPDDVARFQTPGILLAAAVVVILCLAAVESRGPIGPDAVVRIALLSSVAVPFFLPGMHERYFFAADVIAIVWAFYFPRGFLVPVAMGLTSLLSYFPFLLGRYVVQHQLLAFATLAILVFVIADWVRSLDLPGTRGTSPAPPGG